MKKKENKKNHNQENMNHGVIRESCRSQWIRKPIDRITYYSLFLEHHLFMDKIEHGVEPNTYQETCKKMMLRNPRRNGCIQEKWHMRINT